ncbi:ABC transporter permease [Acidicapsa ligni]|uniref:ABC transporter permease n=1 Tax=Acidicapsa ligni TaxID=542300 RepID=UPI0021E06FD6|nr:ABC transporter permease [Acidicapsa ligni]
MRVLQQDLAYTFRRLSRAPGFVIAVVVSIGLGIAANATIFSMVSRFVLRPAPVGDPSTLLNLHTLHDGDQCCNNFPQPVFKDLRDQAKSFSGVAAYNELVPASIGGNGEPERVWGQATSANFFRVLQIPMTVGRGFLNEEENQQTIVLSHRLWKRRFASDPNIAGKAIVLSGRPYTVVGVAPEGFRGVDLILDSEFWVPLGNVTSLVPNLTNIDSRDMHWLAVVARLKPGVTQSQARSELATLAKRLAATYPATDKGNGFLFEQAGSLPPRDKSTVLLFLGALSIVVLLVLCIACANVANLLLAQTAGRQREMAVRLALGATRARIVRQMMIESILLALSGGVLGAALSLMATHALSTFRLPAPVPLDLTLNVDWRVMAYTFALSVGAGLIFGMIPAWVASRPRLANALKGEDALARPGRKWTLRNVLIIGQIAMCLVLLTSTGLFLRSLQQAANIDIGFRSNGILSLSVDPRLHSYTPERTIQFFTLLRQRVAALPGVASVVVTDSVPLNGGNRSDGFHARIKPKSLTGAVSEPDPVVEMYMATPGYFEAMGIPRLAGRDFAEESPAGPKVAVINQVFAQKVFGAENPIGQVVMDGDIPYQVIGVVANIKARSIGEENRAILFRSLDQTVASDPSFTGYTILVRYQGNPEAIVSSVRDQIRALDPAMAVYNIQTMQEHLRDAFFLPRLAATLFGTFGAIGLTLAAVGLYGVMNYSVSRRTREIGIRMALGAQVGAVQRLIVRQGMVLTCIALIVGLPAAFALAKLFTSVLYGIHTNDLATFVVVPVFLAVVAFIACWLPARRASRVDPQIVLRYE